MEIGRVDCNLSINIFVDCPNEECGDTFDLFDIEHLTDEGTLHKAVLSDNGLGTDDLDEVVQCPSCGIIMKIGAVTW